MKPKWHLFAAIPSLLLLASCEDRAEPSSRPAKAQAEVIPRKSVEPAAATALGKEMIEALAKNNHDLARQRLRDGADPNAVLANGSSVLMAACLCPAHCLSRPTASMFAPATVTPP